MKKLLMILAFTLPLMAQEVEVKEVDGKTEVTVKKQHDKKNYNRSDMKAWKQRGDRAGMKRDGMKQREKRMAMAKRNKMHKKRAIRSFVRVVVIGGIAYYIGYLHGEKNNKGGWDRKPPMGDK